MRIPAATYRLQLHADFTLGQARELLDYLHALGITDLYLSPVFEARPGSTHGYDVTDPTRISAALGGRAAFDALAADARARGMGVLLDIVPNHMAASEQSPWWRDVLQRGSTSRYSVFYDIHWGDDPATGRVLLPILGCTLEQAIERDELQLVRRGDGSAVVAYYGRELPLRESDDMRTRAAEYEAADASGRRRILSALLAEQHYQLAEWQMAGVRLGYRRFFDITDLAGLRVEHEEVFRATHALILELVAAGSATGLRVDHVDGLRAPTRYLHRLAQHAPVLTLVEKILERDEPLPAWPVAGTTGYDFLNVLNGLFIEPNGHERIVAAYRRITGDQRGFAAIVREKKHLVLVRLFGGELTALTHALHALLGGRYAEDAVRRVLAEVTACMPVYRTYMEGDPIVPADAQALAHACDGAARHLDRADAPLLAELRAVLHGAPELDDREAEALDFVLRWQQFSGPVMAKGFEDTALYTWTPLLSANEVGSAPARPVMTVDEFHSRMAARAREWPHAQSATATHDTKRGEDVRTRLDVLTELAEEWRVKFSAWARRSTDHKEEAAAEAGLDEDSAVPNAQEESLLYQTLLGAWPLQEEEEDDLVERVQEYMTKALREAKESTSWRRPDPDYEAALGAFVAQLLAAPRRPALRGEIRAFAHRLSWYGALTSLSQVLIKTTAPGFPDFYQGTELWSFALVDPDNRRPVDYAIRRAALAQLEPLLAQPSGAATTELLHAWRDGRVKLFLTAAALRHRRAHATLYEHGDYQPLVAEGTRAEHVVAYARSYRGAWSVSIAPRWYAALCAPGMLPRDEWGDTVVRLPEEVEPGALRDVFTGRSPAAGEPLRLREVLAAFPVALLA